MAAQQAETREGAIFTGTVKRKPWWIWNLFGGNHGTIVLFLKGRIRPVGKIPMSVTDIVWGGPDHQLIDKALQCWTRQGLFRKTIVDPKLLSILEIAQQERLSDVEWHQRQYRFLPIKDFHPYNNIAFILTEDKSDIPAHQERQH